MSSQPQQLSSKQYLKLSPPLIDIVVIISLIVATILINWKMINDGLNGTGDLRWHMGWLQHFSKQLAEGIWYPRWLAGTNFGYGSPTMVFYPPLIYYIGSIIKFMGFNLEETMTILLSLAIFLSGLAFYIYGCHKWGKLPAFIGALFYMTTPAIIGYTNGGVLLHLFALVWIPLGAYLTDKSFTNPQMRIPLAVVWTAVALTHTPSLLLWAIAWGIYTLYFLTKYNWKIILGTLLSAAVGWGMASLYILPALIEKAYVNIDYCRISKGGFIMMNLGELLRQGISDSTNKQLLAILVMGIICFICNRQKDEQMRETWGWLALISIVLFFISDISRPIWALSSTLMTIETSWRLGGLLFFAQAGLCGLVIKSVLPLRSHLKIFPLLIIGIIILTNFKLGYDATRSQPALRNPGGGKVMVREWMEIAINDPYSDKLIDVPEFRPLINNQIPATYQRERYTDAGIPYIKENETPTYPVPIIGQPQVSLLKGKAQIDIQQWASYERKLKVMVSEPATIRIRTYTYPAWHLYINNQPSLINQADDGTMLLQLEPGLHEVILRYQWTPAFTAGVILSLLSLGVLIYFKNGQWIINN